MNIAPRLLRRLPGNGSSSYALMALIGLSLPTAAHAGITLTGPGDSNLSLGAALRTSYTNLEKGAPDGTSSSNDFEIDSVRLFTSGQIMKGIKATINFEHNPSENMRVMDGIAQFEPYESFNLWMGRMLPPSDRANLAGPYFENAWQYPGVVSQYPAIFAGRDTGLTVWGKPLEGKLTYALGAFKGHNNVAGGSDTSDRLLYTGRLAYAFLDAEPAPAYYVGNTYYGAKDILTLGVAFFNQKDGIGTSTAKGDYKSWNVDGLFEKKIGGGALTAEAAYYKYDLSGQRDCGDGLPGAAPCPVGDNVGGLVAGKAYLGTLAYLIPTKVGVGQFQPFTRYQEFKRDVGDTKNQQTDLGVHYVIAGHNARVSAVYSKLKDPIAAVTSRSQFILGVQLMY
jgi:hypothetical protein